jgi:methyl-accepting chemotaxis protein
MTLNQVTIGKRLGLAFGTILLISMLMAGVGVWRLVALKQVSSMLATDELERQSRVQAWRSDVSLNLVRVIALLKTGDAAYAQTLRADMDAATVATVATLKRLDALITDEKGRRLMQAISARRDAYRSVRSSLEKRKQSGHDVAAEVDRDMLPLARLYQSSIEDLDTYMDAQLALARQSAAASADLGVTILVAGTLSSLVLSLVLTRITMRSIVRPITQASQAADAIASGDLTVAINAEGKDEVASLLASLARMRTELASLVGGVRMNAESVAAASSQIAQGNLDLSARTDQQASSLQQTAASMEQLSKSVQQTADNAKQADRLALNASQVAKSGQDVVSQVVDTMRDIEGSSRQIAEITGVIDGIAFKTNILALNAAVEAARAGEQGRGFAVVASEVRTLALRSAEAARKIKSLIEENVERVERGTTLVGEAGGTMIQIMSSITHVSQIIGEISEATAQQSHGVAEVGEAVSQMDQATQQNAALVEESAAAAESLKGQAQMLVGAVGVFTLAA